MPKNVSVIDIIQIAIIAFLIYHIFLWVKNTRSYRLLKGILLVGAFLLLAYIFRMEVITSLMRSFSTVLITALVVVFQPELRNVLEQLGNRKLLDVLNNIGKQEEDNTRFTDKTINELVRAAYDMGEDKTGALIVVELEISLADYIKTGIPVDAVISGQLLENIFEHNTPLHDGAVIVRGDRIEAATCYLPLSENTSLSKMLGTRHRAGVGISEVSDSFTIIVSEETGMVSYAAGGELKTGVTPSELKEQLHRIQPLKMEKEEKVRRWKKVRTKGEKDSVK